MCIPSFKPPHRPRTREQSAYYKVPCHFLALGVSCANNALNFGPKKPFVSSFEARQLKLNLSHSLFGNRTRLLDRLTAVAHAVAASLFWIEMLRQPRRGSKRRFESSRFRGLGGGSVRIRLWKLCSPTCSRLFALLQGWVGERSLIVAASVA